MGGNGRGDVLFSNSIGQCPEAIFPARIEYQSKYSDLTTVLCGHDFFKRNCKLTAYKNITSKSSGIYAAFLGI